MGAATGASRSLGLGRTPARWLGLTALLVWAALGAPNTRALADSGGSTEVERWLARWPAANAAGKRAPITPSGGQGAYVNAAGRELAARINAWYAEGSAAGLSQYAFRSYCGGHSTLRGNDYPQLRMVEPIDAAKHRGALTNPAQTVYQQRVTFGVRSQGVSGELMPKKTRGSVIEYALRRSVRAHHLAREYHAQDVLADFYRRNFLFVVPAVGSYSRSDDFSFLLPFNLHSVGRSESDKALLRPILMAAAALPPALATRILRQGLLVPTLMQLFKEHYAGGLRSRQAHATAYRLLPEAAADWSGPAPVLTRLVEAAHQLTHVPPIARINQTQPRIERSPGTDYPTAPYVAVSPYHVAAVLRPGESLELDLDLSGSFVDTGKRVESYRASFVRGSGDLEQLAPDRSRWRLRVPWRPALTPGGVHRTDVVLLVNDGSYDSAPAYVSIKHLQAFEAEPFGLR